MKSILKLFAEQVEKNGSRTAVEAGKEQITYNQLDQYSNNLASYLQGKGIDVGQNVIAMLDPGVNLIIATMGIFKSKGSFVPVDPRYPDKRIEMMLKLVEPAWMIVQAENQARIKRIAQELGLNPGILVISDQVLGTGLEAGEELDQGIQPNDPCYIYFTSGSTGVPKGIVGCHKGLAHFINWEITEFKINETDRVTQLVNPANDPYLRDVLTPLCAGATVVIPPSYDTLLDGNSLAGWIAESRATLIHCVPSLFKLLLYSNLDALPHLKHVLLAGEQLPGVYVGQWYDKFGTATRLINLYGPTETTLAKLFYYIEESDREKGIVPIGKPIPGAQVLILDEEMKLCPPGKKGEIYIRTPFMTLGYWNNPEKNAESFLINPLTNDSKDRVYKTGDLGRYYFDGNVEFLGRVDHQIKLRGHRIEPGSIETVLLNHQEIKDVAVIDRIDQDGEMYLAAYLVAERELSTTELRTYLSEYLPEYMIPGYYVRLDKLPLSPAGKIDRKALAQENGLMKVGVEYIPPRNETEEQMVQIWAEVLQREQIGIKDNFFDLGGHSLKAAKISAQMYERLNISIPLGHIFEHPTIAELMEVIGQEDQRPTTYEGIKPYPKRDHYPVSHSQKRLWIVDQMMDEDHGAYNVPQSLILKGDLDIPVLERAIQTVIQRHDSLRTRFGVVDGEIAQIIEEEINFSLEYYEQLPLALDEFVSREIHRPFELTEAGLIRGGLARINEQEHLFIFNMHHIISDAWSINVFVTEVVQLYSAFVKGEESPLAELPLQYRDYSIWQHELMNGTGLKEQQEYWVNRFSDELPVLNLPLDYPRPPVQSHQGDVIKFEISSKLTTRLDEVCRKYQVSRFMVLLSAYYVLLYRYTDQTDLIIGTPIAGRPHASLEGLIGYFLNVLPLRVEMQPEVSFANLLTQVKRVAGEAYDHQDYPIDTLIDELDLKRDVSRAPLFETMFNLINIEFSQLSGAEGLTLERYEHKRQAAKFDLAITLADGGDFLFGEMEYTVDLFKEETVQRIISHYLRLLEDVVTDAEKMVKDLQMLSVEEIETMLSQVNQSEVAYPEDRFVVQIFEEIVEEAPLETAVVFEGQALTYQELNRRANQLAHWLLGEGVGPDTKVCIMVERSFDMVTGVVGILKSGGAYVPIDPNYPTDRIKFMLEDTEAPIILTQSKLRPLIPDSYSGSVLELDLQTDHLESFPAENPNVAITADTMAYVVYTSGSTGRPKGVIGRQGPLANIYYAWKEYYKLDEFKPVLLQTASISFDGFLCDLCHSIFVGGTAVICPADLRIYPEGLYNLITATNVNMIESTPGIVMPLVEYIVKNELDFSFMERLIVGSDVWYVDDYRYLAEKLGDHCRVINCYGITETTVDVSVYETEPEFVPAEGMVPIGRPFNNVKVYILDRYQNPVPVGVAGEICIAGKGVNGGYWNRPDLQEQKFISDPFVPGSLIYRSGDLGRYLPDGNIEFLGRMDNQVKIRGYRIEVGEIEATLLRHPEIREAIVIAKMDDGGQRYLAAYIETDQQFTVSLMRDYITQTLPEYMVPATFMFLSKMPITPNGKIDRRALPEPDGKIVTGVEYAPPRNQMEMIMSKIWAELLNVERVGIDDNFFELGGDSLKIIQLTTKINETLEIKLNPGMIYTSNTVRKLCQEMAQDSPLNQLQCVVPIREGKTDKNIFCPHPVGGGITYYQMLSTLLDEDYNIYGIQARGMLGEGDIHYNNEERVAYYLQEMQLIQPEGPYLIMAYCAGGDVAYEMVRQLKTQGQSIEKLCLLDCWPFTKERLQTTPEAMERRLWINYFNILGVQVENLEEMSLEELYTTAMNNEVFLQRARHLSPRGIESVREVFRGTVVAWINYYPETLIEEDIYLFRAIENLDPTLCKENWQVFTSGSVEEIMVPGNHATMLDAPHIQVLAEEINKVLKKEDAEF